ncbi:MAG: preprotein translocase YidC, partial [Bacteroidetes bacterium]
MSIFEIILSPFIFIIKQLFDFSYGLTDNYGAAIILLSFFISALLLPVFILIEKAKKKDDIIKRKMQPLVDEIKRAYKGQERYYYLKTLNRQHNYSPFKALVPILSLLLQIPFFIAAYQFLEHLETLEGVSFWFISDLSIADGLLGGINFLPISMTL